MGHIRTGNRTLLGTAFSLAALSVGACGAASGEGDPVPSPDAGPVGLPPDPTPTPTAEACDQMDIVFVIDDSGSMLGEQENLAANFPGFVDVLDNFRTDSGLPIDYRVAITSTGVSKSWDEATPIPGLTVPDDQEGDDGRFAQTCGMTRPWLERADADVADTFACAANVGTDGPIKEMPLEAMNLALTARTSDGANGDFLRDEALLAIVILTDENDCSRTDNNFTLGLGDDVCDDPSPVADYVDVIDAVKGDRGRWATAVIAGIGPGDCSSDLGAAAEATRLVDFAAQVGQNAVTSSICEGDLSSGLAAALETFEEACNRFPPIE